MERLGLSSVSHTLADALLDDLEDMSDDDQEVRQGDNGDENSDDGNANGNENDNEIGAVERVESDAGAKEAPVDPPDASAVSDDGVDKSLQRHLAAIRKLQDEKDQASGSAAATKRAFSPSGTDAQQHQLVVESNRHLRRVHDALHAAHQQLCVAYQPRFPELADLVPDPDQYAETVRALGRTMDPTRGVTDSALNLALGPHQVLSVAVAASATAGRPLTDSEWETVSRALDRVKRIQSARDELTRFVEHRLRRAVPNVCALVGSAVAAQLLGLAGGVEELARIPACNLQVLGQTRSTSASRGGWSTAATTATPMHSQHHHHRGVLVDCDLVRNAPQKLQAKVLKAVASKVALAARCDAAQATRSAVGGSATGGSSESATSSASNNWEVLAMAGLAFRGELERKMEQWQQPDQAPVLKALPKCVYVQRIVRISPLLHVIERICDLPIVFSLTLFHRPDLTIKKRRGGKRVRRIKEKYEETALMKQANTRAFSAPAGEYGDDAMGRTRGLLDTGDGTGAGGFAGGSGGTLRRDAREIRKMRQSNTKASRKRDAAAAFSASSSNAGSTSGLATSLVFTPVQGLELANPESRAGRVAQANQRWFNEHSGFRSAVPKK